MKCKFGQGWNMPFIHVFYHIMYMNQLKKASNLAYVADNLIEDVDKDDG